jgi:hypothetical protein
MDERRLIAQQPAFIHAAGSLDQGIGSIDNCEKNGWEFDHATPLSTNIEEILYL